MKVLVMGKSAKIVVIVVLVAIVLAAAHHLPSLESLMRKIHGEMWHPSF
jgi:mannitol/fructose-specific phosphotransferase system IIA component (Ntr-type)